MTSSELKAMDVGGTDSDYVSREDKLVEAMRVIIIKCYSVDLQKVEAQDILDICKLAHAAIEEVRS